MLFRSEILPSERAKALKMQLEAIKHQGSRTSGQIDPKDAGKRSNEIVAERNKMAVKQVQRYIRLNELVPDLMKLMDEKKLGFTTAVELSYVSKKNQNYIAVAIDSQQSSPSQAQAKRMRELDEKKLSILRRFCDAIRPRQVNADVGQILRFCQIGRAHV